jgi:hypothetical protein
MLNHQPSTIYDEIEAERCYQIDKWGLSADRELNTPADFISYIANYSTKWQDGSYRPYTSDLVDDYRKAMIQTATLAVAAVLALDFQREHTQRAFFEKKDE